MMESILIEADKIINHDRQSAYGHPLDDLSRTAAMWTQILGVEVTAEQVGICMIALKISRYTNKPKYDSLLDMAGYVGCVDMIIKERKKRDDVRGIYRTVPNGSSVDVYTSGSVGSSERERNVEPKPDTQDKVGK